MFAFFPMPGPEAKRERPLTFQKQGLEEKAKKSYGSPIIGTRDGKE
jgi:hypothetical protein